MKLTNIIKESKTIQRENKGPCWDGYQQIGMKMKGGKEVPNCVPKNEANEASKKIPLFIPNVGNIDDFKLKSLLQKNPKVKTILGDKEFKFLNQDNTDVIMVSGKPFNSITTDGELEFELDLKKNILVKPLGKARPKIVAHYSQNKAVSEATHTSAPGEWVGFVSKEKGKKLMGVFKSATGAKSWLTKNQNSLLNQSDVRSVGIKPKKDWDAREAKYAIESVSEATHTSQPGEWVGYIETPKGDKLMGKFKSAIGAKQWLSKNSNKLLNTDGVQRVGIMGIDNWNKFHAKWAVESVNEMNVNKKFGSKYDIGAGSMGSGTTFWNRAQEVSGDYKTIAHVSDNGKVTFYDKKLPNDVKKHIEDYAKTKTESVNENCGCGGAKTTNPYSLSEFVIKENDYKLGDVEYTAKNMGPVDIMKLAFEYHQTPITKLAGKNIDHRIRVSRDLGRLIGKSHINPNEKGKEPAWLLYPYKGKLVSTEEYKELYKGLFDKLKRLVKYIKNADPATRQDAAAAKAVARADIKKEF
jgi:hypothetical protein